MSNSHPLLEFLFYEKLESLPTAIQEFLFYEKLKLGFPLFLSFIRLDDLFLGLDRTTLFIFFSFFFSFILIIVIIFVVMPYFFLIGSGFYFLELGRACCISGFSVQGQISLAFIV
jgi:hypothetical protein